MQTKISNAQYEGYLDYNANGGNDTQDKIFLLSYREANKYFEVAWENHQNKKSHIVPTDYAIMQGASTNSSNKTEGGKAAGYWWLRSPGYRQYYAASVSSDGSLYYSYVNFADASVRPAFYLNLKTYATA